MTVHVMRKAKPFDMLVYVKDYDSSADYQILSSFGSSRLNHSKHSIENVGIRPIQEYSRVSVFRKTTIAVVKLR